MNSRIDLQPSLKKGINSQQSFVIFRGQEVFLRLLGTESRLELMSATAGEDHGNLLACRDQSRLIQAALRTAQSYGLNPAVRQDRYGRSFVGIGAWVINEEAGSTFTDFVEELEEVCERLFKYYDGDEVVESTAEGELLDIYDALAIDKSGDAVYLSDGVWLGSDGSFSDVGR